jgi:hypothetical protein
MLAGTIKEIFIAQHSVDFRKGADGLIAECYKMALDPYKGECVVFIHKSRRSVKIICGDAFGVWVLLRRFEGGCLKGMFRFLADPAFCTASVGEVSLLLEGATFEVTNKVKPWKIVPDKFSSKQNSVLRNKDGKEETYQY